MAGDYLAFITDMHLAPADAEAERAQSGLDRPARRARHLQTALEQIREHPPAAVLFGGDNTNQPVTRPAYRDAGLQLMDQFPKPWHAIPGNHDVGSCIGWHHHNPDELSKAGKAFREAFGPDRWVLECAGFRVIAANSQIFGADLPEAREQEQWLADELATGTDLVRVFFIHTPLYLQTPEDDFDDGSEQMCLKPAARRSVLDILNQHPPELLITGHCHRYWACRQSQWDWLGLPATALGQHEMNAIPSHGLPDGHDAVGWVALRRQGNGWQAIRHEIPQADLSTAEH